jgi:hypothetical protein
VGESARLGKLWLYDPSSDVLTEIAAHDTARFANGGSSLITEDEESSGIIPAPFLGEDWYLARRGRAGARAARPTGQVPEEVAARELVE